MHLFYQCVFTFLSTFYHFVFLFAFYICICDLYWNKEWFVRERSECIFVFIKCYLYAFNVSDLQEMCLAWIYIKHKYYLKIQKINFLPRIRLDYFLLHFLKIACFIRRSWSTHSERNEAYGPYCSPVKHFQLINIFAQIKGWLNHNVDKLCAKSGWNCPVVLEIFLNFCCNFFIIPLWKRTWHFIWTNF